MKGIRVGFIGLGNLGLRLVLNLIKSGTNTFIYDSDGNKKWTKLLGTSDHEMSSGISIGSDGSIYITGTTNSENPYNVVVVP